MPRPFEHVTGTFFLNVRIPKDLLPRVRGTILHIPVGDEVVAVKASTKVFLSLRTKDPNLARERFPVALAALTRRLAAVRDGPKPLTHKQLCALAGETYASRSLSIENDPEHGPHVVAGEARMAADDIAAWQYGDSDDSDEIEFGGKLGAGEEIDHGAAVFFARIQRPYGAQLLALELNKDIVTPYVTMTRAKALEDLFGADADRVLADHGLVVDEQTRLKLLAQIGLAMGFVHRKVLANADGDYSVDFSGRFPVYEKPALQPATVAVGSGVSISRQIELFCLKSVGKRSPSTIRRYTPCLLNFARFLKDGDIRLVTSDDAMRWAEKRRDVDGVSAAVVNYNDLCAVQSLFSFCTTPSGGKLRSDNPIKGVRLDVPKKTENLDKKFLDSEVASILSLARGVTIRKGYPRASACRRWAPWICAYTGARIQEVCALQKTDVRLRDGAYVIHFAKTKEGVARWVTVHNALRDEGFIDFCRNAPDGPLFCGDKRQKDGATRCAAEQRASELTAWVRSKVTLEDGPSPSHAWRHTFITYAREAGMYPPEMVDAITGHNRRKNASDGYYSPTVKAMVAEMAKFPAFAVEGRR